MFEFIVNFASKIAFDKLVFVAPKNAVIARKPCDVAIPRIFRNVRKTDKRPNALTNRPELLGDCHDQSADWSRNDSKNR